MMNNVKETRNSDRDIVELANQIATGKCTKRKTKKRLQQISSSYDAPFLPYKPDRVTCDKWDLDYLKSLEQKVTFGATSYEFLTYMTEVADFAYRPARIRRVIITIGGILLIISILLILVYCISSERNGR